jgi:flagellar L-ring protein precursor FlgH
MIIKPTLLVAAALLAFAAPAAADTLYVPGPAAAAPGHPMHLGADHRATQVGDLVHIIFNFNGSANNSDAATTTNSYTAGATSGSGVFNLPILRLGAGLGGNSATSLAKTQTVVQTFTSSMTAVVTNVLPSGALQVAGDQKLTINGIPQALHVTGTIRQEDLDNTDSVLSSNVANIDAKFSGIDTQEHNKGILQKIVGFLFG